MDNSLISRKIQLLIDEIEYRKQRYNIEYSHRIDEKFFVRKTRSWIIKNIKLYKLLMRNDISLHKFSYLLNVSQRATERWLFEGINPDYENRLKTVLLLGEDAF